LNRRYHGRLYAKAQNHRRGLRAAYDRAFEQVDLLMMPTTAMKSPRLTRHARDWRKVEAR